MKSTSIIYITLIIYSSEVIVLNDHDLLLEDVFGVLSDVDTAVADAILHCLLSNITTILEMSCWKRS